MTGILTGRMFDRGYHRLPLAIASAVLVTAVFLTAQCTKYWQFLLCQGILAGVRLFVTTGAHPELIDSSRSAADRMWHHLWYDPCGARTLVQKADWGRTGYNGAGLQLRGHALPHRRP